MNQHEGLSLNCLPALVAEIDARRTKPTEARRAQILKRYKGIEAASRREGKGSNRGRAVNAVTEYLIEVLWQTRKYRREQEDMTKCKRRGSAWKGSVYDKRGSGGHR